MPDPPFKYEPRKAPSESPVRTLAALSWLAAALAVVSAGATWSSGTDSAGAMFYLGLGSGAAYLAMALPRRIVSAWRACRHLMSAIGTIQLVVLPSLAIGWVITFMVGPWGSWDASLAVRTQALAAAGAATALPWAFYHLLSDHRVRTWFCIADFNTTS